MNELWTRLKQALMDQGPTLAYRAAGALVIVVVLMLIYAAMVRGLATLRATGRLSVHSHTILRRIGYWAATVCGALLVLQQFGLMENAWTTLTAMLAMVAVGFVAVWSVLSNTLCSVILMVSQPFEVGDTVEFPGDDLRGKVVDFNLIFTTLRDDRGHLIQVPNNTFFQKPIRREVGAQTVSLDQQADRTGPAE
jgi:small-conductance mechanosensitive channel